MFLKYLIRLTRNMFSNLTVTYREMGICAISVLINTRMIRFWSELLTPESNKYASVLDKIILEPHCNGQHTSKWMAKISQILADSGFD